MFQFNALRSPGRLTAKPQQEAMPPVGFDPLGAIKDNKDTYTKSMKLHLQYLNDQGGNLKAVQIPIEEWAKLEGIVKKYEQTLQVQEDLQIAFDEVRRIRAGKVSKQTLSDFLDEL